MNAKPSSSPSLSNGCLLPPLSRSKPTLGLLAQVAAKQVSLATLKIKKLIILVCSFIALQVAPSVKKSKWQFGAESRNSLQLFRKHQRAISQHRALAGFHLSHPPHFHFSHSPLMQQQQRCFCHPKAPQEVLSPKWQQAVVHHATANSQYLACFQPISLCFIFTMNITVLTEGPLTCATNTSFGHKGHFFLTDYRFLSLKNFLIQI